MLLTLGNLVPWVFGQWGPKHLSQMMLFLVVSHDQDGEGYSHHPTGSALNLASR